MERVTFGTLVSAVRPIRSPLPPPDGDSVALAPPGATLQLSETLTDIFQAKTRLFLINKVVRRLDDDIPVVSNPILCPKRKLTLPDIQTQSFAGAETGSGVPGDSVAFSVASC